MNVTRTKNARLYAASDPLETSLNRVIEDFNCIGYLNYLDLLSDTEVDAFIIATPTQTHFEVLMKIIPLNKPIFVEKPLTYTIEEAEMVVEAANKYNTFIQVGHMRRFDPGHMKAKNMIDNGEIGKPIYIHDCQRDPNGPPAAYVPQSGGLFVDMGIHDLDVARWLMGSEIVEVYAQGSVLKHNYLKELNDIDNGQILLKFENGGLGMIEISRNANDVYDTRTEIIGLEKSVFVGQDQLTPCKVIGGQTIIFDMANWVLDRFKDAYELEIQAFCDCVLNEKPSPVTAYDGMTALKLAIIATQSHHKKEAIRL